ncbi:avidin-related protein 1-like [Protobothrops mucrosquamatus]|uniref:avidin-related protein 1-like n=1 Tax=Protobothrops mucrosquamatus TaxID=103944 RepID=UPI000775A0F9|nr:avidin-related protein 1-like [Protobothrops mucrosquamatus]
MAIGLAALGLLAFLLGCSGTFTEPQNSESADQCSLTGTWKDDRGLRMEIFSVTDTGLFSGLFYIIPYNRPRCTIPPPLQGIQHEGRQPIFAFTFRGNFHGPIALYVGQCLVDENGKEQLRTTWVRRSSLEIPEKYWEATR